MGDAKWGYDVAVASIDLGSFSSAQSSVKRYSGAVPISTACQTRSTELQPATTVI